jgi:alcohol dehydrogenase class IV
MGVSTDKLDDLVAGAIIDPSCGGNPIELTKENLRALFIECI